MLPNFHAVLLGGSLSSDKDVILHPLSCTPSAQDTIAPCSELFPPCFVFRPWDLESGNLDTQSPWPAASEKCLLESRKHKAWRSRVPPSFANNHGELDVTAGSANIAEGFTIQYGSLWVPADRGGWWLNDSKVCLLCSSSSVSTSEYICRLQTRCQFLLPSLQRMCGQVPMLNPHPYEIPGVFSFHSWTLNSIFQKTFYNLI
jgi:hypothetical protein